MTKQEQFLQKSKEVHGDKYDYSKSVVSLLSEKVTIICPEHGEFSQQASKHMGGRGCFRCSNQRAREGRKKDTSYFVKKSKEVHGDKYDYSKAEYTKSIEPVIIICPEHGEFEQKPHLHMQGRGCPECGKRINGNHINSEEFISRCKEVHGDKYDYSKTVWNGIYQNVVITCPIHGDFEKRPHEHTTKQQGCPKCTLDRAKEVKEVEFVKEGIRRFGGQYDYSQVDYRGAFEPVTIICKDHGVFTQTPSNHLHPEGFVGCKKCSLNGMSSMGEDEVSAYISSLGFEVVNNSRQLIPPKEIDLFVPELNLGIEYCGLYWHSDIFRPDSYHKNKLDQMEGKGYRLVHVFEDEWINSNSLVKKKLRSIMGIEQGAVYARNCEVFEPRREDVDFLYRENHIQGSLLGSINLALWYKGCLVCAISFKQLGEDEYDLVRFAVSTRVIGGFSKLLKHFIRQYSPKRIVTYADRRWGVGNLYIQTGFTFICNTRPNYFYVNNGERVSRHKFQKHRLKDKLQNFDPDLSERENMKKHGFSRIYDCGHKKFEMILY